MRIWVDDVRPPPPEWQQHHHVWAKSSDEAIDALARCKVQGLPCEVISLDHDLGGDDTSRKVVLWMINYFFRADEILVHSANPVGWEWLEGMIERYLS